MASKDWERTTKDYRRIQIFATIIQKPACEKKLKENRNGMESFWQLKYYCEKQCSTLLKDNSVNNQCIMPALKYIS